MDEKIDTLKTLKNIEKNDSRPKYETRKEIGIYCSTLTTCKVMVDSEKVDKAYEQLSQAFKSVSLNENQNASNFKTSHDIQASNASTSSITDNTVFSDSISFLFELCQQKKYKPPEFEYLGKTGPQHEIKCKVIIDGEEIIGEGKGNKKKNAKENAAADVIRKMNENPSDPNSAENKKLIEYLSEYFSDNQELSIYIDNEDENDCCKKLAKIVPIIGCGINYIEYNNRVILQLVITHLSQNNNILLTSYGSSDKGIEESKILAAKKAILMLRLLNM